MATVASIAEIITGMAEVNKRVWDGWPAPIDAKNAADVRTAAAANVLWYLIEKGIELPTR